MLLVVISWWRTMFHPWSIGVQCFVCVWGFLGKFWSQCDVSMFGICLDWKRAGFVEIDRFYDVLWLGWGSKLYQTVVQIIAKSVALKLIERGWESLCFFDLAHVCQTNVLSRLFTISQMPCLGPLLRFTPENSWNDCFTLFTVFVPSVLTIKQDMLCLVIIFTCFV